jgi:hypothetical protein
MLRVAAYICWSAAGLSILALCCNLNKIRIAAAIIKSAAEFTKQECKIIIVPFLMFLSMVMKTFNIERLFRLLGLCLSLYLQLRRGQTM